MSVEQPEGYDPVEEHENMVAHIKATIDNSYVHQATWEMDEGKKLKLTIVLTPND